LYFPTGGGKSEAFFGLLIFNLFFDRRRGKQLASRPLILSTSPVDLTTSAKAFGSPRSGALGSVGRAAVDRRLDVLHASKTLSFLHLC